MIALAGKPMVKVTPIEEEPKPQRLGFMVGKMPYPEWFFEPELDREVVRIFYGEDE